MKNQETLLARTLVKELAPVSKKECETLIQTLVGFLAARHELYRIPGVIEALESAWRQAYGAATITIETPYTLSSSARKKLETFAPGAEIKERVIPELIGGARLRVDETIIDGSVQGHLLHLAHVLRNA